MTMSTIWVGQVFHSQFNAKARGTAILIHKVIPFEAEEVIANNNGGFVIVAGRLFTSLVILVNVYAPNYDDYNFFNNLLSAIPGDNNYKLIIGGDFISLLSTLLERSSNKVQSLTKSAEVIKDFIAHGGVSDNLLSTDKATYLLTKAWFNVYDSGDKAGKLLSQQARQAQSSRLIPKIYSQMGKTIRPLGN